MTDTESILSVTHVTDWWAFLLRQIIYLLRCMVLHVNHGGLQADLHGGSGVRQPPGKVRVRGIPWNTHVWQFQDSEFSMFTCFAMFIWGNIPNSI